MGRVSTNRATVAIRSLRVALFALLLAILTYTPADPDLWGHVAFGRDIVRDARIHTLDSYSFTSDKTWVNQLALQARVVRGVDDPHAAVAEFGADGVRAEGGAEVEGHGRGGL